MRFADVPLFWRLDLDVRTAAADDRPAPAAGQPDLAELAAEVVVLA